MCRQVNREFGERECSPLAGELGLGGHEGAERKPRSTDLCPWGPRKPLKASDRGSL